MKPGCRFAGKMDFRLEHGMIVALEPKAYLSGTGPAGLENTCLITESGCEKLCGYREDIVSL